MASVATLRDLIEALIESTKEKGKIEKVSSDLERFFQILSEREEIRNVLGSSVYSVDERKAIVGDIGVVEGFDELTINFICLVIELDKFKSMLKSQEPFMRKIRKASGKVRAEIIMAINPSESDLSRVKEALSKLIERDVEIIVKVDPTILGGVIAKVEDKMFDGSIKTQLERIRDILSVS
jgi:F-type H+-transporting ATPase subunit delta